MSKKKKLLKAFGIIIAYLTILLLFSLNASGQTLKQKLKIYAKQAPGYYVAGFADGLNQTIAHHYGAFKRVHPGANDQYWNPDISWTNKGDNFLMRTVFVGTTDGYHLTRTIGRTAKRFNTMYAPRIAIPKQKWYWHVIDFAFLFVVESLGFHTTYSWIYK